MPVQQRKGKEEQVFELVVYFELLDFVNDEAVSLHYIVGCAGSSVEVREQVE